ncbi:MAG: hypothetical protein GWN58_17625 [Anaerolineae bacterium]|nr:hypothetical protein [Anaerolineae bacterium]
MRRRPEDALQIRVASWLDDRDPDTDLPLPLDQHRRLHWCHVPNEGKRSPQQGALQRAKGLKAGIPDVLIFEDWWGACENLDELDCCGCDGCLGHGIAIELKVKPNRVQPGSSQDVMLRRFEERGWLTAVCYSLEEVQEVCGAIRGYRERREHE